MSRREYRLLRELGSGTFGCVYQAELVAQEGFRKEVALKILNPEWETHEDAASRFRDEARLLGRLRHRYVVRVDGLIRLSGRWAVVMEYVPGEDTSRVIKALRKAKEPFPVVAALEITSAVAAALHAAWETPSDDGQPLQVVHRDIKPSNIRLTPDGEVKVLDFGIARARFEGREAVTHDTRYGSIRYMSPERRSERLDSPAGDVYALGCVLYECLGLKSFGNAELEWAQHAQRIHEAVQRLQAKGLHEEVIQLISEMLAFEARRRPGAAEVEERCLDLSRRIEGEDLRGFTRRFLPEVGEHVEDTTKAVEEVLTGDMLDSESLDGEEVLREDSTEFTFASTEVQARTTPIQPRVSGPPQQVEPRRRLWPGVVAGVVTFLVLAVVFLGVQLLTASSSTTNGEVVFEVPGATEVRVTCGGRGALGKDAAGLVDAPTGPCEVSAQLQGQEHMTQVRVEAAGRWTCQLVDDALSCSR